MKSIYELGVEGEKAALEYLLKKRYKLIVSRFRYGRGEIDLIMRDGKTLVFVEVKYRKDGATGDGLQAVTKQKQQRLRSAAEGYAMQNSLLNAKMRFDVIEIAAMGIIHIENAF
jgi:TIGR00252 family protein